jgi:hypothetical protein
VDRVAVFWQGPTLLTNNPGTCVMGTAITYVRNMMRNEPITFLVMLLMIAILLFGLWDILKPVAPRR